MQTLQSVIDNPPHDTAAPALLVMRKDGLERRSAAALNESVRQLARSLP